jgi:hypothetical protein
MPQNPYNAPVGLSYANIKAAGTTVVKASPGLLGTVTINSESTGATLQFLDAITGAGTVTIGTITTVSGTVAPSRVVYGPDPGGINFVTGLVVVATGTIDATIAFR